MPFGLSSSRSSKSSAATKSSNPATLSDAESGRMNMSGILHDGIKKNSNKSRKSPRMNHPRQHKHQSQQLQHNHDSQEYHSQEYHSQEYHLHTPPRLKSFASSQRSRSDNVRHNHFQPEMYSQSYSSGHDVISQSYSNHSAGSRQSSQSRHSMTSSSASGQQQMRHHHHHHHHNHHNHHHRRISSEPGSVHSHPTVTSRSTISDPSGHSRISISNSSYHRRPNTNNMHQQFHMAEHRDPHGETTNTRRTHHHSTTTTPQRYHQNASHSSSSLPPPSSPIIKPTPMKNSSTASVSSFHSRGSVISYNSLAPNSARSTLSATTSVVSTDKYAIKSTKKVIDELKKSNDAFYPPDKRIIALTNACAEFDHLDDSRHNMELQQGAAIVLYKALALILNKTDKQHNANADETGDYGIGNDYEVTPTSDANGNNDTDTDIDTNMNVATGNGKHNTISTTNMDVSEENDQNDDALRMIVTALEMVFRGQAMYVHTAYDKCGGSAWYEQPISGQSQSQSPTGLLSLLLLLLDRAEGLSNNYRMKPHNAEVALVNTTKVLLYLSRVPELRTHLAKQSNLVDALCRVANKETGSVESNSNSLSAEARIARVRIITNLVNQEENKPLLLSHRLPNTANNMEGGVLDALLRVAHTDPNDRAREYAGAALMDLASAQSNQIPMTKNEQLLGTLVKMIFTEKNPSTRESAITALQNLAFTKENRIRLVSFKNGVILEALIRALSNNQKEFNEKSRRRSAGALTNLACDESAGLMGRHKGLLQTLAIVSTKDESPEVQTRSAMALTKLAASITVRMDRAAIVNLESNSNSNSNSNGQPEDTVHSKLLDALVVASLSPVSNSVSAVLRVKARDPENRHLMANHPGIIDTLADMCLYDDDRRGNVTANGSNLKSNYTIDYTKDRDNATRALMHLTNESKNRSIMCTPSVLKALVRGASIADEEIRNHPKQRQLQDIRDSAIRAIERLATEFSNRHTMAHHDGLIVAIARATEREAKLERVSNDNASTAMDEAACSSSVANGSVEMSSYASSSVLTPQRPNKQSDTSFVQHAYLAKPLLMSLLVAM